jgi:hypothetical protein
MARLRQGGPALNRRQGVDEVRRADSDLPQILIGLTLVVVGLVGLVYMFSL